MGQSSGETFFFLSFVKRFGFLSLFILQKLLSLSFSISLTQRFSFGHFYLVSICSFIFSLYLSLSICLSFFLSLSISLTQRFSFGHFYFFQSVLSFSLSIFLYLSVSIYLSFFLSLSLSLCLSFSFSLIQRFSFGHFIPFNPFFHFLSLNVHFLSLTHSLCRSLLRSFCLNFGTNLLSTSLKDTTWYSLHLQIVHNIFFALFTLALFIPLFCLTFFLPNLLHVALCSESLAIFSTFLISLFLGLSFLHSLSQ